ncbi:MAG: carbohydrate ABC transporter permease [Devosia nanyangense]|uniref:Carbohydrate ABC transporter permease n=1 Tax=Devosia nanyangense TaxID=1228055 RepID=A0A933NXQ9_9HYPH|nr:carbohydrate ABC transporter permease [Devosia nanyangense]
MTTEAPRLTIVTGQVTAGRVARRRVISVVAHVLLIGASILMLYPLLWMLSASFRPEAEIFSSNSLIPSSVSLHGYSSGWFGLSRSFDVFFLNSFIVSILCVIGNLAACSLTAFAFARLEFWGRRFWFALMLGTLMLPYQVVLIPQYVLFLKLGWVNSFLPLVVPKYLAVDAFFIFLMVQFFRGIPRELDEAAMMDGCSPWRIYFKIMLPLSLPVMTTAGIFTFIFTWDDFFAPLIYLNDLKTYTVTLALRTFVDSTAESNWSGLFAMSILSLLPIFVLFLFFQRLLIEGIATTGMKR